MLKEKSNNNYWWAKSLLVLLLVINSRLVLAAGDDLKVVFDNLRDNFSSIITLVFSLSVVAGLAFAVLSAFKFKQFKDNPTQITIGQPISLLLLAGVMLWLPYIINVIGNTLGAPSSEQATVHGQDNRGFGKFRRKN